MKFLLTNLFNWYIIFLIYLLRREQVNLHGLQRESLWWKAFGPLCIEPISEHLGVATQTAKTVILMR
ncbi:MAG: hypothetical protein WBJ13_08105, partial [Sedimentibacter sp.]